MTDQEFNEIAGRLEAISRLATAVVAELEDRGVIDGVQFSNAIRSGLRPNETSPPHFVEALKAMQCLADSIDDARAVRRTKKWQLEHPNRCNLKQVVLK